jgi:hypothetical protein
MTWFDHSRRAASVILVALFLLAIPAVANARFTSAKASGLSVGTDRMETPSGFTGTYRCAKNAKNESISVTIDTFTDAGPAGSYGFFLTVGTSIVNTASSPVKQQTLEGSRSNDDQETTWTIGIQGSLGGWTSSTGTKSIVCPANASRSGDF